MKNCVIDDQKKYTYEFYHMFYGTSLLKENCNF